MNLGFNRSMRLPGADSKQPLDVLLVTPGDPVIQ